MKRYQQMTEQEKLDCDFEPFERMYICPDCGYKQQFTGQDSCQNLRCCWPIEPEYIK